MGRTLLTPSKMAATAKSWPSSRRVTDDDDEWTEPFHRRSSMKKSESRDTPPPPSSKSVRWDGDLLGDVDLLARPTLGGGWVTVAAGRAAPLRRCCRFHFSCFPFLMHGATGSCKGVPVAGRAVFVSHARPVLPPVPCRAFGRAGSSWELPLVSHRQLPLPS